MMPDDKNPQCLQQNKEKHVLKHQGIEIGIVSSYLC
jgi:hypothetical protein